MPQPRVGMGGANERQGQVYNVSILRMNLVLLAEFNGKGEG